MEILLLGITRSSSGSSSSGSSGCRGSTRCSQRHGRHHPIVGLTALILALNINAPSIGDVRVIKYVVQVIPQVKGRVIDVPAEGDWPSGGRAYVLFRIDPTPYESWTQVAGGAACRR